jgi:carbon monoxide dehydrogenase subunit G
VRLENGFSVPAPPDEVWRLVNDVPRVVPCMPGAQLSAVVDENTWEATMQVKLGPVSLEFGTTVKRERVDETERQVLLSAAARELRGRGGARATIESTLAAEGSGTRVAIVTELNLQGAVAQYGRGIVPEVAAELTKEFAECLARQLQASESTPSSPGQEAGTSPRPVGGLRLFFRAVGRVLRRRLRR